MGLPDLVGEHLVEMVGYLASALVLTTFLMRTMIPLRLAAITSNVVFITYGLLGGLTPILVLHSILLPLNIYRTVEMLRLIRRVDQAAGGDLSADWLKPFMKSRRLPAGQRLFSKGDRADRLYMILQGEMRLVESGIPLGPGHLLGEIGLFAPDRSRTQSAVCETDVHILWIEEKELAQLCYQNPAVAFHLLRLITARLTANLAPPPKHAPTP